MNTHQNHSPEHQSLISTARITGFWYLLLAIFGVLGFLVFHPKIFVPDNPHNTLNNLIHLESIARIRFGLELIIILSQALAAVWFFKLFVNIKAWAAFAIGGWGLVNAAAIMVSAIAMGSALEVAHFSTPSFEEKKVVIQVLNHIISQSWAIGGLFFGLWLIPMGHVVVVTKCMPIWLGRMLIIGGFGYLFNTLLIGFGFKNPAVEYLTIPATIGEFWMIGYLLIFGIRPSNPTQ